MIKQTSTYKSECSSCSNSESSSLISSYSSCSSVKTDDNKDDNYPPMSARPASRYFRLMQWKKILFKLHYHLSKNSLFLYYRNSEVDIDIALDVDSNDGIKAGKNLAYF